MKLLSREELEALARREAADAEIYGIGNHSPEGGFYDPLEAYQQSQTTAYPLAQQQRWLEFFEEAAFTREHDHLMSEEERAALEALPERVTVYRGLRTKRYQPDHVGFSWTLSREVAERFANVYRKARWGDPDGEPIVLEETIDKDQIVWLIFGRNEQEVVICPW